MRFLLRPGWLALIVGVLAFAAACYTLLAPWQFGRNAERSAQNEALVAAAAQPPVPLVDLVPAETAIGRDVEWRQVTVSGRYQPDGEVLVRLRVVEGRPAFEVLTPFRTVDGRLVTVDRGYVRPAQGSAPPPYRAPPGDEVTLTARLRLDETDPQGRPVVDIDGRRQVYAADSRLLGTASGLDLEPGYLQLSEGQPGGLGPLPLPEPQAGPFLSYAWQWLTFGVLAIFGLGYFIRLELLQDRQRRRAGRSAAGDQLPDRPAQ